MLLKGNLIDGRREMVRESVIDIENGRIRGVDIDIDNLPGEPVDLGSMTILPGLIDAHVHLWGVRTMDYFHRLVVPEEMNLLRAAQDLAKLIDAGYTSVRDAGSRGGIFLRNAVAEGTIKGPRIKTPGLIINQTGGHVDKHFISLEEAKGKKTVCRIADGSDECRRAVREQVREGADYIKICVTGGLSGEKESPEDTQFCEPEIRAMVEEAEARNLFVAAHAQGLKGTRNAVQWGISMIEHGVFLDEALCLEILEKKVLLTPTLTITSKFAREGDRYGSPPWAVEKAKRVMDDHIASFQLARQMGVCMGAGTDFSGAPMLPHGQNAYELEMMVSAGYSPMEAIQAAIRVNSRILGMEEEIGTLEPGKLADIIIVDGDPLADITILKDMDRIKLVMKGGVILKSTLPGLPVQPGV
jgi:imidazolonepropionase-like amidohydrolase